MRQARVYIHDQWAGTLEELIPLKHYRFSYREDYEGPSISLTMPKAQKTYEFDRFPSFFEGLLPEGPQLEGLLRIKKLDRQDYFSQLLAVGEDLVGAVTIQGDQP